MRLGRQRLLRRGAACALPVALVLAGCAPSTTGGNSSVIIAGRTLTIVLGQPGGGARGQPARDVLAAERLAFDESGGRDGPYTLRLRTLAGKTLSDNARAAIADPSTIAYLGELVPGTSEVSVEIVNQQGLLEVSPLDTAAYLTQPVPPVSNSVQSFYPGHVTYHETFARVVPTSAQEARALVAEMQSEHVSSLYVADDGQRYGATLALEIRAAARTAGLTVSGSLGSAQGAFFGGSPASASGRAAGPPLLRSGRGVGPEHQAVRPLGPVRLRVRGRAQSRRPTASGRLLARLHAGQSAARRVRLHLGLHLRLSPRAGTAGRVRLRGDEGGDRRPAVGRRQRRQPCRRRHSLPLAHADGYGTR